MVPALQAAAQEWDTGCQRNSRCRPLLWAENIPPPALSCGFSEVDTVTSPFYRKGN